MYKLIHITDMYYIVETSGIGFAVAKARLPKSQGSMLFKEFSDIISRDSRIPSRENTVVGYSIEPFQTHVKDHENAKIWNITRTQKNSLGCALVPGMELEIGGWIPGLYAYGFQGFDNELKTYIAGLFGYNDPESEIMSLIASGFKITSGQLETTLKEFFDRTGLASVEFDEDEKGVISKKRAEVIKFMNKYKIVQKGGYIYLPLLATETDVSLFRARRGTLDLDQVCAHK